MLHCFFAAGFAVECHIGAQGGTIHGSVEVFDMSGNDTFTPLDGVFASAPGRSRGVGGIIVFYIFFLLCRKMFVLLQPKDVVLSRPIEATEQKVRSFYNRQPHQ